MYSIECNFELYVFATATPYWCRATRLAPHLHESEQESGGFVGLNVMHVTFQKQAALMRR
jgi:hypothetical protein